MTAGAPRLELRDPPDGAAGRSTEQLIASLAGRLSALLFMSGAEAVGAQIAGFAAVGRQIAATADGARLRARLERSRPGVNGEMIWQALRLREWLAATPPTPVLDDLADDLALLLAPDLADALRAVASLPDAPPRRPPGPSEPVDALDCLLGVWAVGRQFVTAIELLAATAAGDEPRVAPNPAGTPVDNGSLLR